MSIFVILVTPIVIILGLIGGTIGGIAFVIITFGPTIVDTAYNAVNGFLSTNLGIDIEGIKELIDQIKQLIESISSISSSMGGGTESALLLL